MKKFISMIMAAAMTLSLVPATAFAADPVEIGEVKIVGEDIVTKKESITFESELQIEVSDTSYPLTDGKDDKDYITKMTFTLDKAEWNKEFDDTNISIKSKDGVIPFWNEEIDGNEMEVTFTGKFEKEDIIIVNLDNNNINLKSHKVGTKASIAVEGGEDFFIPSEVVEDTVFVEISDADIAVTARKVVDIVEEEEAKLDEIKIKSIAKSFSDGQKFKLTLNDDFVFSKYNPTKADYSFDITGCDDNELIVIARVNENVKKESLAIKKGDIVIDAADSDIGDVATLKVKALRDGENTFTATADAIKVAKVIPYAVEMSVEKDVDIPVIYSGTNVGDEGLTVNGDHKSAEVTIKETFPGAWDMSKKWSMTLPEGVYVVDVNTNADKEIFKNAYVKGDFENFEFVRNAFNTNDNKKFELTFDLVLVAEPGFTGDVVLGMGDQEVVIAEFVSPYTVSAPQNNVTIDYRNTKLPNNIVIKEAEADLWARDTWFDFDVEKEDYIIFEGDPSYSVNRDSEMKIKDKHDDVYFTVKDRSDDKAAEVKISNMKLFMDRNIPAGGYDLMLTTSMSDAFDRVELFGGEGKTVANESNYSKVVAENFIKVITGGSDQGNTFTTKVEVPIGTKYIFVEDKPITIDVPAYINADGYTMLPVRAVAKALGIDNRQIVWNDETDTVSIFYGSRIITMTVGKKVINVNGAVIPAASAVEITDGRMFLPMRDLATALGVTDVTWDATNRIATLNGNR